MSAPALSHSPLLAIDRYCSDWLKGAAILLMMAHHLFGLPSLIEPPNSYVPLIPGVPFEYWIGRFGKICVSIFLLLSGYGFAMRLASGGTPDWRYFFGKAWRFLLAYWPYFLLAYGVGLFFFQERMANGNLRFPEDVWGFVLNALTIKNSMAFEWWFAETYLLLVLLTRPLLIASRWPLLLLAGSLIGFVAGAALDVMRLDPTDISFANLLIWQLPWVVGILAVTWDVPDWIRRLLGPVSAWLALAAVLAGFVVVEVVAKAAMTPFLILATPLFVFGIVRLFGALRGRVTAGLSWLGRITLGLWLVHPFGCYYFFQKSVYAPHYSPLVFAALLLPSIAIVLVVENAVKGLGGAVKAARGKV